MFEPEELMARIVDLEEQLKVSEMAPPAAEQLIACLEGEIAKRDEELAACRIAVENCELFRARIAELEARYQRDVYGLNNECDPIGGDPAGGYANDNARLRAELAAIKAQEPVSFQYQERTGEWNDFISARHYADTLADGAWPIRPLYAAPVSEAKAQGVVMPERKTKADYGVYIDEFADEAAVIYNAALDEVTSLNAATSAPAADACKACKGTGRRPIGGRGRIFGLTNRCFECQPLTAEEVYGTGDSNDQ